MKTDLSFEKNVIQPFFFLYLILVAFKNSDKKCIDRCT